MFFHVILTTDCDLRCTYCFGEAEQDVDSDFSGFDIDYKLPHIINYDVSMLDRFCRQDPDCVLTFYGGEPLLQLEEMKDIMDNVRAEHFMVQTNGVRLDRLEPEYVNRLHTILVSIDGDRELTDLYRGKGTFSRVVQNLKTIKKNGFNGELIARMTVMEQTDILQQVKWLLNNDTFSFSSVHWQLNAGFWRCDFSRRKFRQWCNESYDPGISSLADFWVDSMVKNQVVLRLYPFLGIAQSLLFGEEESLLRCGAGWINYAIQTDGHIVPCPTMWGLKDYYLGHISNANPLRLKRVLAAKPCTTCDISGICGGRCLYANIIQRWNTDQYSLVCKTVRNLIEAVKAQIPQIRELIEERKISLSDFEFMKYNGCEIIP